jgi:hypothetical protein
VTDLRNKIETALRSIKNPSTGELLWEADQFSKIDITGDGTVNLGIRQGSSVNESKQINEAITRAILNIPGAKLGSLKINNFNEGPISKIKYTFVVSSGKGGVGKSTTSVGHNIEPPGISSGSPRCRRVRP